MSTAVAELLARVKQLTNQEKVDLTYALFEEYGEGLLPRPDIDEAWLTEVKRREAAALAGNSSSISWLALKEKIEARRN